MFAMNAHRVAQHTAPVVNERIRRDTVMRIAYFAAHPQEIARRLTELDAEWDVERALGLTAAALSLIGVGLASRGRRGGLLLAGLVQGFFLSHAVRGWCPPLPVLRRLGVRTSLEIERERYALKALRGDFRQVGDRTIARRPVG